MQDGGDNRLLYIYYCFKLGEVLHCHPSQLEGEYWRLFIVSGMRFVTDCKERGCLNEIPGARTENCSGVN